MFPFILKKYDETLAFSSVCKVKSFQINLMAIMAMGRVYESLALKLTRWGNTIT